jgi:hypothetical protein
LLRPARVYEFMLGKSVQETSSSLGREGVTLLSELGNRLGPATSRRSRYGVRDVIPGGDRTW